MKSNQHQIKQSGKTKITWRKAIAPRPVTGMLYQKYLKYVPQTK